MTHTGVRVGMKVKITGIGITHDRHNSCSEMDAMVGKTWTVKRIRNSTSDRREPGHIMVTVNDHGHDFVWAPEDLQYAGPKPVIPKKGTFDPEKIVRL